MKSLQRLLRFGVWELVGLTSLGLGIAVLVELGPELLVRKKLLAAIRPIRLTNCDIQRFGDGHDGGYLLCRNLLSQSQVAYSYGIDGRDEWGCDVSRQYSLNVHQYDCFNVKQPTCEGGQFTFHAECVGDTTSRIDGRNFDTLSRQIDRNGDTGKHLVMKMDVEGAEWDSLAATSDEQLRLLDQLVIEFHGVSRNQYVSVMEKLKRTFYIVNVHMNNYMCTSRAWPMPSTVFEVLLVNRRLGIPESEPSAFVPKNNPLDAPNATDRADCQIRWD